MKKHISRKRLYTILAALVLLAALAGSVLFGCRMGSDVTIGGTDVSELTLWQAWQAVSREEDALQEKVLTLNLPEQTIILSPREWKPSVNCLSFVWKACWSGDSVDLEVRCNEKTLRSRLEDYAAKFDTTLTQPSYQMGGSIPALDTLSYDPKTLGQTLVVHTGTPERHLDVDAAMAAVREHYSEFREEYTLTLEVPPEALPDSLDLEPIHKETTQEAVNDSLDMQTYQLIPGAYGYSFDLEAGKKALERADWGTTVALPFHAAVPEILGEAVYFRDLLGHCETKHNTDENRNTNLRLVCQLLDGMILPPGEEFSYNGSVGERTEERGFKAAGAYSGNRLVQDIGGGVCQGSTTLYNCALLADLEILERNCHGFTVTYVPIGMDAAVNWATKTDMRFKNNWNFPIRIRAEVSDGYMKMELWGTDEKDYYIEMTSTRSDAELRIYSSSYKSKYDKITGEQISRELEARSSYMYFTG